MWARGRVHALCPNPNRTDTQIPNPNPRQALALSLCGLNLDTDEHCLDDVQQLCAHVASFFARAGSGGSVRDSGRAMESTRKPGLSKSSTWAGRQPALLLNPEKPLKAPPELRGAPPAPDL